MDFSLIWKAALIVLGGTLLLRIAGRKSISQLTLAQVVIMIGLGSLLVQPLVGKSVWSTLAVGFVLVLSLVIIEFSELKFDFIEKFVTGRSKIIIEDGQLNEKNLKKLRFTVDLLETQLREKNITKISDVQYATLEPNGQVGIVLKEPKQPATKEDISNLMNEIQSLRLMIESKLPKTKVISKDYEIHTSEAIVMNQNNQDNSNIFEEINNHSHENHPPKHLQ